MLALFVTLILETASASPFRVLVFPHHGNYPIPQGREIEVSKVKITSDEVCNQYQAQLNSKQEWVKTGNLMASEKTFSLTAADLRKKGRATYFECSSPFKIHRDAGQEAYSYEGSFVVLADSDDQLKIVNLIDPEKYLEGVVPAEVGKDWPAESLKAQAVAARTYAWWTVLNEKSNADYDLDDTVQYQAYSGILNQTAATDTAVSDTAHQVMKYAGKVIKAYFSADSGGKTETAKNVFGEDLPYCVSKEELYDLSKTKTAWETQFELTEISKKLSKKIKMIEVAPVDINPSGRVDLVTITTQNGAKAKVSGTAFRQALKLRSTLFQLEIKQVDGKEIVIISGKGYGHGVGMTQIGARELALQLGWTFDQIVKFYYTGITLESVTNDYLE